MSDVKAAHARPIAKLLRKRGWNRAHGTTRRRIYDLAVDRRPWWDWGHRLMVITGSDFGGSWDQPNPPTWWYRRSPPKRQWRTGFPHYPLSTFEIVTDHAQMRRLTDGLDEDQMYEWQAIGVDQDGDLILGHRYWGGTFYGLRSDETAILRRYLRMWRRLDWYGARSWLYKQGLHAAVHAKRPGACNAVPPEGSGGYSHWHCELDRRHDGMHQFRAYRWGLVGGEVVLAHVPEVSS